MNAVNDLFGREEVIRMPPLSKAAIESVAEEVVGEICPEALERPTELDLLGWVDHELPQRGIHVSPADPAMLGDAEGLTLPDRENVEILIAEPLWDGLLRGGRRAYRGRATVAHELGHAVLHVATIRRRMKSGALGAHLLKRVARGSIKTYECPEWQAWTFAGFLMAPRRTVNMLADRSAPAVSEVFGMSVDMARVHKGRLGIR